ncbi:MAG: hypothetical protein RXQ57_07440 [Caldivirga sp.]
MVEAYLVKWGRLRLITVPGDSSWELVNGDEAVLRATATVVGNSIEHTGSSMMNGSDGLGRFILISINGSSGGVNVTFTVKVYDNEPVVVPTITFNDDVKGEPDDEGKVKTASLRAQLFLGRVFSYTPYNWIRPVFINSLEREVTLAPFAMFINPTSKATVIVSALEPRAPQLLKLTPSSLGFNAILGFSGTIGNIPRGTVLSSLIVYGDKPTEALNRWGRFIRGMYGRVRTAIEAYREFIDSLQYWTDTGGMYWYRTLPGMNYMETMMEVKRYMDSNGIGVRYYQVDSWWYPKNPDDGGAIEYREVPELGGDLKKMAEMLGPLVSVHLRYISKASPYVNKYSSVVTSNATCITEPERYFDDVLRVLKDKGVLSVKHDWLTTIRQRCSEVYMTRVGMLERYLDSLLTTAKKYGILVELCMPDSYHYFIGSRHDNALMIRTSSDYGAPLPKHYLLYQNAYNAMLALQLGYSPFFDVMVTKDHHAYADLLARVLFYSVVGIGDAVDKDPYWRRGVNVNLLRMFLSPQWTVLRPDSPAELIDDMYLHDPYTEAIPLIALTSIRGVKAIALFNVNRDLDEVCYTLKSDELNLGPRENTTLLDLRTNTLGLGTLNVCVRKAEPHVIFALRANEPQILGLSRYALPPVSIIKISGERVSSTFRFKVGLVEAGELMAYSPSKPSGISINGKPTAFNYNENSKVLITPINEAEVTLDINY